AYKKALHLAPMNAVYLYGAAYAALNAADYNGAVTAATQLLRIRPNNVAVYHIRMLAYGHLYLAKQQLSDARHIIHLRPNDPQANNDLGIAYANNKQYRPALRAFTRAIHLQSKNYTFY